MLWYLFTPPNGAIMDPTNPEHYSLNEEGSIPAPCIGNNKMYALKASPNNNGLPDITEDLILEIYIALSTKEESLNVLLKNSAS